MKITERFNRKKKVVSKKGFVNTPSIDPVSIDYPLDGEKINKGHYAIRISVSEDRPTEISINGKEWKPCRSADGFKWFDWTVENPGKTKIISRVHNGTNEWIVSKEKVCFVD
ncbi:hypothetical protein BVX98_07345 [bacterium F11]|nr:hypothetical protein BVX98_07345 [bacterium F11]